MSIGKYLNKQYLQLSIIIGLICSNVINFIQLKAMEVKLLALEMVIRTNSETLGSVAQENINLKVKVADLTIQTLKINSNTMTSIPFNYNELIHTLLPYVAGVGLCVVIYFKGPTIIAQVTEPIFRKINYPFEFFDSLAKFCFGSRTTVLPDMQRTMESASICKVDLMGNTTKVEMTNIDNLFSFEIFIKKAGSETFIPINDLAKIVIRSLEDGNGTELTNITMEGIKLITGT